MRTLTLGLLLTAGTLTLLGVGYAVRFDRKRRNDPKFRKQLKLEKQRAAKAKKASEAQEQAANAIAVANLLKSLDADELPVSLEEKEMYFMQQVGQGETLAAQNAASPSPALVQQAALCFYRALKVYPAPVDLVMIYQKTLRKEIFDLITGLFAAELQKKQEDYYESFPPHEMNVVVKEFTAGISVDGNKVIRKGLTAARDLSAGEVVFTEKPDVSCLQPALEGIFCSFCMKKLPEEAFDIVDAGGPEPTASGAEGVSESEQVEEREDRPADEVQPPVVESGEPETAAPVASSKPPSKKPKIGCSDCAIPAFCSERCRSAAMFNYHEVLCTGGLTKAAEDVDEAVAQAAADEKLIQYCQEKNITFPLMIARFLVQMAHESARNSRLTAMAVGPGKEICSTWDHIERLRYLEVQPDEDITAEHALVKNSLGSKFEGMHQFINLERYAILQGKLLYNCLAVHTAKDVPGKAEPSKQTLRGSVSKSPIGAGLYKVTSYVSHSCNPNVLVTFPSGTNELTLTATRDITAGEELRMSFIPDVDSRTPEDRKAVLAATWRFSCSCTKCVTRVD